LFFGSSLQQSLRRTAFAVTFSETRIFKLETAIVVEGGAPEHRAVRHHAASDIFRFKIMTGAPATRFCSYTQVTRIDEADVLPTLASEQCVAAFWIGPRRATLRSQPLKKRFDVSLTFDACDLFRIRWYAGAGFRRGKLCNSSPASLPSLSLSSVSVVRTCALARSSRDRRHSLRAWVQVSTSADC
jgi:hypothetical protein